MLYSKIYITLITEGVSVLQSYRSHYLPHFSSIQEHLFLHLMYFFKRIHTLFHIFIMSSNYIMLTFNANMKVA